MSPAADLSKRLETWRQSRNWVAIGNLGEHVTLRLLERLDYQVLGTQDDYLGMVAEVIGEGTTAHPEDFIAVDPDGRLVTVNSKATASPAACRMLTDGGLTFPRVPRRQRAMQYTTLRANLVSPLDGDAFAQIVKVDLLNQKAQIFEIAADGSLSRLEPSHDVADLLAALLAEHPDVLPPPSTQT